MHTLKEAAEKLKSSLISLAIYGYSEDKYIQEGIKQVANSIYDVAEFLEKFEGEHK